MPEPWEPRYHYVPGDDMTDVVRPSDLIEELARAICASRLKWSEIASRATPGPCEAICEECRTGARATADLMMAALHQAEPMTSDSQWAASLRKFALEHGLEPVDAQ